ncbi:MAG: hypothetical protein WBX25_20210 [Rhodomicrobium sp.]
MSEEHSVEFEEAIKTAFAPDLKAKEQYRAELEAAINAARETGIQASVTAEDGTEAYAYPKRYGIAWGLNHRETHFNFLRGIRQPDGTDKAEM